MSPLVVTHVITGLLGVLAGLIVVAGMWMGRPFPRTYLLFLTATFAACATGFPFIPTDGITSAQLVSFFVTFLLAVAAYARYARQLQGQWSQICALTTVGALFLNVLISTTQSFVHIAPLKAMAPTEQSPVYVAVKLSLLTLFVALALLTAKKVSRS